MLAVSRCVTPPRVIGYDGHGLCPGGIDTRKYNNKQSGGCQQVLPEILGGHEEGRI